MKIKTIIFDIGKVLTDSNWDSLLEEIAATKEIEEKMKKTMFFSDIWEELDRGVWTAEEVLHAFLEKGKGVEAEIREFWERGGSELYQNEFTKPLLKDLKSRGYQLLYLSNWSSYFHKTAHKALDFLPLMDGGVFSYEVHHIKPDPVIYDKILEKYDLVPEECVFLDDSLANVKAASEKGIHTIHVTDYEEAREELYRMLEE